MAKIDEIWRSFERWTNRYSKSILTAGAGLHLWYHDELLEEPNLNKKEINRRLKLKFDFFRGYLLDLVFDGPEYMQDHGRKVLTYQYPNRCDSSYGVWLHVADYGKDDFPSPFFSEQEIPIFTPNIDMLDWASMWRVIPYDYIFIRQPYGKSWSPPQLKRSAKLIWKDLDYDGMPCEINTTLPDRGLGRLEIKMISEL